MRSPQDIKKSVAEFYDTNPQGRMGVLQKLSLPKKIYGKNILDAGCGAGYFLFDYLMYGANVTGVDQSARSVDFIREQSKEFGFNPTLIAGDLEMVDLPENRFDYIFCTYVLQHTPHPERVLANFRRWSKPKGEIRLIIANKGINYYLQKIMILVLRLLPFLKYAVPEKVRKGIHWEDRFENPYWNQLTKKEVKRLCSEAGLKIRSIRCSGFTIFISAWLPPLLTSFLDKFLGNYIGKAIYVEAVPDK